MGSDNVIELVAITKRFGDLVANDAVNFELRAGEIHAILGENGAGKSTLMKILFGIYRADEGEMRVRGRRVNFRSPADAIRLGIGMVHQELMLIPELTGFENIILGAEPTRRLIFIDRAAAWDKINDLAKRYHLAVDFRAKIRDLSVGEQQRIAILKELYRDVSILIFDEPTSSLGLTDKTELLRIVRRLADAGQAVVPFITHKLQEVFSICDRVTVLRHGRVVGTYQAAECDASRLTKAMFEYDVRPTPPRGPANPGPCMLRIHSASLRHSDGRPLLDNVTLEVHQGEILGIAGVSGNGQLALGDSVLGLRRLTSGRIWFGDQDVTDWTTGDRLANSYAHIFEDRVLNSIGEFSLRDNAALSVYRHSKFTKARWLLDHGRLNKLTRDIIARYNVKCSGIESRMIHLSGGNQQKLVLGRILATHPRLLWAHNPTKGLDLASCQFIFEVLADERASGTAIVLISEDLDELLTYSDRIAVMFEGGIQATYSAQNVSLEELSALMVGRKNEQQATTLAVAD